LKFLNYCPFFEDYVDYQNPYLTESTTIHANHNIQEDLSMVLEKMNLWNSHSNSQQTEFIDVCEPQRQYDRIKLTSSVQSNQGNGKKRIWISGYGLVDL